MDINTRIKDLEEELEHLKNIRHNQGMEGAAKAFVEKLKARATEAELKFMDIAQKKGLKLEFQHKINIYDKNGRIKQFFIVDFCDPIYKICFEVDGEYHNTPEQKKKDYMRSRILAKAGYKVYRITNEEVLSGKSTQLILSVYSKKFNKNL